MKLQRVRAVALKETRHLLRDPGSLAMMVLMPVMLLFIFGYAIRLDVLEAPIGVFQEATDGVSGELTAHLDASRAFRVSARYDNRRALGDALQAGHIWAGIVIPHDFARELARGDARIQLLLDGVDANTARLLRNYARTMIGEYALRQGAARPPLVLEERVWFNEARESRYAILPGVIALVMAVMGALMTSLTIAREMELGNLVMLCTTPLSRTEFLCGKLAPYLLIGLLDVLVAAFVTTTLFDVPLRGSLLALVSVSTLFLLVVLLQGALISMVAGNQMLASQMAMVSTFLPALLLSGFVFAVQNMPRLLEYITYAVPARYYVTLCKAIFLKGVGPLLLWTEVVALVAVLLLLAIATVRRAARLGLLP
jgi:ABC-2 type transport system permease protein